MVTSISILEKNDTLEYWTSLCSQYILALLNNFIIFQS